MTKVGPYSRQAALSNIDGRTKEARLLKSLRAELIEHVGGAPSTTQRLLIDQCVQLQLRIALIDRKTAEGEPMTEHDSRTYLAWCNSLARLVRQLGMKAASQQQPTLRDHLAKRMAI